MISGQNQKFLSYSDRVVAEGLQTAWIQKGLMDEAEL
jgi:hypothetical protein